MIHHEKLGKIKSVLFSLGFLTSQLKYIPFSLSLFLAAPAALVLYLSGYLIWLFSSHFYPEHPHRFKNWYSFAQFRDQHKAAASLGVIAIAFSLLAFFIPILTIPSLWLLAISSGIWCISEYHKLKNPLAREENYSHSRQKALFRYSAIIASLALVFALTSTIPLFFPVLAPAVFLVSLVLGIALGVTGFRYWIICNFGDHKPDENVNEQSYGKCMQSFIDAEELNFDKIVQLAPCKQASPESSYLKKSPFIDSTPQTLGGILGNDLQPSASSDELAFEGGNAIRCR